MLATAEGPTISAQAPSSEYPDPGVDPFDPPEEEDLDDDELLPEDPEEMPDEDWDPDQDPLTAP